MFDIARYVCEEKKRPPFPEVFHKQIQAIIEKCWQENPKDRPSFKDILLMLRAVEEPKTKQPYSKLFEQLVETGLPFVCHHLTLTDLYRVAQVSKNLRKITIAYVKNRKANMFESKVERERRFTGTGPTPTPVPLPIKLNQLMARVSSPEIILHENNKKETTSPVLPVRSPSASNPQQPSIKPIAPVTNVHVTFAPNPQNTQKQRDYEKELNELKNMLQEQQRVNEELLKFKKKYEEHYRKKLNALNGPASQESSTYSNDSKELLDSIELYDASDDEESDEIIIVDH